jgi:hypothetical protein
MRSRGIWVALSLVGVVACAPERPWSGAARPTVAMCWGAQIEGDHFGGQLTRTPAQAASIREFTAALRRVNEPPLYCGRSDAGEEYRLLRLGTNGVAAVVRAWRQADSYGIVVRTLEATRERPSDAGRSEAELTREEWLRIVTAIEGTGLWRPHPSLPSLPGEPHSEYFGRRYVIEGRRDRIYRAVEAGSPQFEVADATLAEIAVSKVNGP